MKKQRERRSLRLVRVHGKLKFVKRKKSQKFSRVSNYSNVNWEKVEKILSSDKDELILRLEKERINSTRTKELLRILATGAVIGMSFVMPTLPMAIAPFVLKRKNYYLPRFNQTIKRLKRQKLVEIIHEDDATLVKITKEGKLRALRYKIDKMQVEPQRKWDRMWRVVIFDIPEKEKRMREIFRDHLKMLGFYQLQKSVWVHAYPCFDEIEFLRELYHVGFNVSYIVAKQIEDDSALRLYFKLET